MTYLNTDIYTTKHKGNLTKISINDYDNDETITLDLTEKELEILYDVIRRIREFNIFPRTNIYALDKKSELWEDKT